jgi:hypothetical protein
VTASDLDEERTDDHRDHDRSGDRRCSEVDLPEPLVATVANGGGAFTTRLRDVHHLTALVALVCGHYGVAEWRRF